VDAEIIIAISAVFISIGLVLIGVARVLSQSVKEEQVIDAVCKQHDWQRFPSGMICVKCKRSPVADYIAKFDPDFD
jgi:hypothetical protein